MSEDNFQKKYKIRRAFFADGQVNIVLTLKDKNNKAPMLYPEQPNGQKGGVNYDKS